MRATSRGRAAKPVPAGAQAPSLALPAGTPEIELKLKLDPADLARVLEHPAVLASATAEAHTQPLVTVYYDTADHALADTGFALRVRESHGRNRLQSLKGGDRATGFAVGGVAVRREWEWPLKRGRGPDLSLLQTPELQRLLPQGLSEAGLVALFRSEISRTTVPLALDGATRIELALDEGRVVADGHGSLPLAELELELKAGAPERLYAFALALNRDIPLRLARDSKAALGFRLALGQEKAVRASKAEPVLLPQQVSVATGFRRIVKAGLNHLIANVDAVLAGDTVEGVHQVRVATRRLRAVLALFADALGAPEVEWLRGELGWLAHELDAARDLDVLLEETLLAARERKRLRDAVVAVEATVAMARATARARAVAAVSDPRVTALVLTALGWLDGDGGQAGEDGQALRRLPLKAAACAWLEGRLRKVRRRAGALGGTDSEARHEFRLAVKKLRYAVDVTASLFGSKAVERFQDGLAELQELLGGMNDAHVGIQRLEQLGGPQEATAALTAWLAKREQKRVAKLKQAWSAFDELKPFWA